MYEKATLLDPTNEELLSQLFMAYVRIGAYKKQQNTALALYKVKAKTPYYFWAVMSVVLQAKEASADEEKTVQKIMLPLAERMISKMEKEGKMEQEQETRLYLMVLEMQQKYKEALQVLQGSLGQKLASTTSFMNFVANAKLMYQKKLDHWDQVNVLAKDILQKCPDQWDVYLDYITSGANSSNYYFKGNGDGTFEQLDWPFAYNDAMLSFATGDFGNDGQMDLIASYGGVYVSPDNNNPDQLYINEGNDNHWVTFDLQGVISNSDAVGAQVAIYGPWGVQLRDVRAGESYGITCTSHPHFGLGTADYIDSAVVHFPSGFTVTLEDPAIDTYHNVLEAPCQIGAFDLALEGSTVLCPGETASITAPEGYVSYAWSNGAEGNAIAAGETGNYTVLVYDNDGCAGISNPISIEVYEPEVPSISIDGDVKLCDGESVTLICSAAPGYQWSNGATEQTILVTEPGTYSVSVDGDCAEPTSSEDVTVEVYNTPETPDVEDSSISAPASANLSFAGNELHWYESETDVAPIFIGNTFETPVLESTTTFWVEDVINHGLEVAVGGSSAQDEGQYHNNSNYWLRFDAFEDIVIQSVKVFANSAGDRTVAAIDASGNVLDEVTVNVPEGESVIQLDLEVPAGVGHGLRSLDGNPQLWRDGQGSNLAFPFEIGGLATITSSSVNNPDNATNYYYFFYDWTVATQAVACASDRVPVTVTVEVSGIDDLTVLKGSLSLHPNPSNGVFQLHWEGAGFGAVQCEVVDMSGRVLYRKQANGAAELGNLDLTALPRGVHILTLSSDEGKATARIVLR